MSGENVDNFFERPASGSKDNALNLGGTTKGASGSQAANVADATDGASAATLANALKAMAIDMGMMAPDP